MQAFVRVVEHGAFGRASDSLGVSRASVTHAVNQLEKHLGVRLLNRTTRRLSLTEEGRGYYEDCVRILGQLAESEDRLSGTRLAPRGQMRVSIPQSFADRILLPALMRFMQRYPEVSVELIVTDRALNLIEEGVDCAIRGGEIAPDSGLVARKLANTCWLTCASPAYLEANGTPDCVADLAQHECVRFVSPVTGRERDWVFKRSDTIETYVPYGRLRVTSMDGAAEAAIAGIGIAQVADAVVHQAIVDGHLRAVLTDIVAPAPSLCLVYPGNRYLTARVRAFADFFAAELPREGWWSLHHTTA